MAKSKTQINVRLDGDDTDRHIILALDLVANARSSGRNKVTHATVAAEILDVWARIELLKHYSQEEIDELCTPLDDLIAHRSSRFSAKTMVTNRVIVTEAPQQQIEPSLDDLTTFEQLCELVLVKTGHKTAKNDLKNTKLENLPKVFNNYGMTQHFTPINSTRTIWKPLE